MTQKEIATIHGDAKADKVNVTSIGDANTKVKRTVSRKVKKLTSVVRGRNIIATRTGDAKADEANATRTGDTNAKKYVKAMKNKATNATIIATTIASTSTSTKTKTKTNATTIAITNAVVCTINANEAEANAIRTGDATAS